MSGIAYLRRTGSSRIWGARVFLALALVAALARAAVPVGFMPTAQTGSLEIIICGADGATHALLDLGGKEAPPAQPAGDHCVFAIASAALQPVAAASVVAPLMAGLVQQPVRLTDVAPGRGLAAPPPPARGPPVLT